MCFSIETIYIEYLNKHVLNLTFYAVIAIAIGPAVYFYKNMKPFFKYTFPSLKIDPLEKEIWRKVQLHLIFNQLKHTNSENNIN